MAEVLGVPDYRELTKLWDDDARNAADRRFNDLRKSGVLEKEALRQSYLETNKAWHQTTAWKSAVKGGMDKDEAEAFVRKEFDSGPDFAPAVGGLITKAMGPLGRQAAQFGLRGVGVTKEVSDKAFRDMERAAEERYPKTGIVAQLGGAIPRYVGAGIYGGPIAGPLALSAAEAFAGRPNESMAGLAEMGLGAMGMDRAAEVAKAVSENPYGRAVTDLGTGLGLNKLFSKLFSGAAKSTLSTIEKEAADDAAERVAKESEGAVETVVKAVDEVVPPIVTTKVKGKGLTNSTKKKPFVEGELEGYGDDGATLSADIPLVKKEHGRSGFIDPSVLMGTARAGIGAVVGGGTGSQVGDTPEERQRNAMLGALAGAGIGAGIPAINRAAAQSESYRGAVDDISRLFRKTSKTAAPGPTPLTPLSPSGITATTASATGGTFPLPAGGVKLAKDVILDPTAAATVGKRFEPTLRQLNLPPDMQKRLATHIKTIGDKLGTVSFEDAMREAGRLLNTQREDLLNIPTDRMTGTEVLAIASMLSENAQKIAALSSEAASATGAVRDQLMDQADELYQQMPKMLKVIQSAKHAQGQALGQNRILANVTTDPTFWILKGQRVKGAEVLTLLEQNTIVSLANSGKQEKLIQYLANIRRSPILDQVLQLRKAGLLTALAGRARDLVGTGAHLIAETAQRAPASLADAVLSRVASAKTGIATGELRSIAAPTIADVSAMFKAGKAGAADAARSLGWNHKNQSWAEFIRDAEINPEILKRYDVPNQINITMFGEKASILADTYSKLALRTSGVTDKLLFAPAYVGALREQASLKVLREGLTGDAAAKRATELLKAPDEEMTAEAILAASTLMFNNDGTVARMLSTIYAAAPRAAGPFGDLTRAGIDFLMPFRRTPANVLTRLIEHTPGVGLVPMVTRYRDWTTKLALAALESNPERLIAVRAAQRKLVQNAMRQGTGALASLGVGFYLYDQGVLTGEAPSSPSEREQWLTEGKTANSILIGDNWYEVGRLSPYGNLLSMAANIRQNASEEGKSSEERVLAGGVDVVSSMLNQPMVTGPRDLLNAATGKRDGDAESWIQKTAGSFVPSFIGSIARSEGVRRQPQSILSGQGITSRIPGMQQGTPARLGIFGQQTEIPGGLFNVGISPVPRQRDLRKSDPLVAELSRVGARIGAVDRPTGMDFGDYQNIQREVGPLVRDRLERIMSSPSYQQADDERRKELIQKTVRNTRAQYTRSYTRSLKTR